MVNFLADSYSWNVDLFRQMVDHVSWSDHGQPIMIKRHVRWCSIMVRPWSTMVDHCHMVRLLQGNLITIDHLVMIVLGMKNTFGINFLFWNLCYTHHYRFCIYVSSIPSWKKSYVCFSWLEIHVSNARGCLIPSNMWQILTSCSKFV